MLYGISLIVGKFGTGYLPDVAAGFSAVFNDHARVGGIDVVLILGSLFLLIGLAFKLSVVPFHFWCPDVFEGAAAEVAGFLSVASKAGAFVLTGRVLLTLATKSTLDTDLLVKVFGPPLAFIAALTATYGNLAAYPQNNLKRLLAYSTIAHAGYMLMGLAVLNTEGAQAVLFYLLVYLFMNLGAFAVVAFIRNQTGSEDIRTMRGLAYRSPAVVILLGVFLLSLLGIPPLAGFVAKFQIFAAVYNAARSSQTPWLSNVYMALLVVGGAQYGVQRLLLLARPEDDDFRYSPGHDRRAGSGAARIPASALSFASLLAVVVLVLGVIVDPAANASEQSVRGFEKSKPPQPISKVGDTKVQGRPKEQNNKGRNKGQNKAPSKSQPANDSKNSSKGDAKS